MQRLILEIGTGNDLYGGNYTKAACRAVQDAIHHSSLILFRSLDISHEKMQVTSRLVFRNPTRWIVTSLRVSCRGGMFPSK